MVPRISTQNQQLSVLYCQQAFDALAFYAGEGKVDGVEFAMAAEMFDTEFTSLLRHGLEPSEIAARVFTDLYRERADMSALLGGVHALSARIVDLGLPAGESVQAIPVEREASS